MNKPRKPADSREKDILLALARIQKGRSKLGETKVTISSVAREAGVSPALIHNHYPKVAETIRDAQGRSSRMQRDMKHDELKAEREKSSELRKEIKELKLQVSKLASINEVLNIEVREFKAKASSNNIRSISQKH
ncbi:TetR/AcrR family transcriptional regulator [Pseudomonas quasicaspiana]|uniref:TetR/AcrR family transcriptional regulator n=1 Tax=Pseudomonas quasicaspiana TaxID=2829821 RepID=UPI001E5D33F2|nr:TetR/AcrR family transcriptional regulator [Pseudomonas quasicaspiana]MCD5973280.1 TetR family transcriptional regulator [Pseudomonas quasicaspiana]